MSNKMQRRTFITRSSLSALSVGLISSGFATTALANENSGKDKLSKTRSKTPKLKVYQPNVKHSNIYYPHPGAKPILQYNHDVDIVKFKGKFFASWNANESRGEDLPGQFNFLSVSDDFEHWSEPIRLFTSDATAENPIETDNQWQPTFINWRDETLFCAWCDYNARKTYIATSTDGLHWRNREVPNAPAALLGKFLGFPTNHGFVSSAGRLVVPCSLPAYFDDGKRSYDVPGIGRLGAAQYGVGFSRFCGLLLSDDGGASWYWSDPIEAVPWTTLGEQPDKHGGDTIILWEPSVFETPDKRMGLLVRNSTAQIHPDSKQDPHHMILCAWSEDGGRSWSKALPIEVDSLPSRNLTLSNLPTGPQSLLMIMNDHPVNLPSRIPNDRYYLSLYLSPIPDPDLLLPGPVVQPQGGRAYYPNGFVENGKLYIAYSYPSGISCSIVDTLPNFSEPFLLPREGRPGLRIENDIAYFSQKQTSLGLILTEKLTVQPEITIKFDINLWQYDGNEQIILTLGGKTREGTSIRTIYSKDIKSDVFQIQTSNGTWVDLAPFKMKEWNHFEIKLSSNKLTASINNSVNQSFDINVLRKICFGGLYVVPEWPIGTSQSNSDIRLNLDSIYVG